MWGNPENARLNSAEGKLWLEVIRLALEDLAYINVGLRPRATLKASSFARHVDQTRAELEEFFFSNQSQDGRAGGMNLHWICDVLFDRPDVARERIRKMARRGPERIPMFKQLIDNPCKQNVGNLAVFKNAYLNVPEYMC